MRAGYALRPAQSSTVRSPSSLRNNIERSESEPESISEFRPRVQDGRTFAAIVTTPSEFRPRASKTSVAESNGPMAQAGQSVVVVSGGALCTVTFMRFQTLIVATVMSS